MPSPAPAGPTTLPPAWESLSLHLSLLPSSLHTTVILTPLCFSPQCVCQAPAHPLSPGGTCSVPTVPRPLCPALLASACLPRWCRRPHPCCSYTTQLSQPWVFEAAQPGPNRGREQVNRGGVGVGWSLSWSPGWSVSQLCSKTSLGSKA